MKVLILLFLFTCFQAYGQVELKENATWKFVKDNKFSILPTYLISHKKQKNVMGTWRYNLVKVKKKSTVEKEFKALCEGSEGACKGGVFLKKHKLSKKNLAQIIFFKKREKSKIPAYYQNIITIRNANKVNDQDLKRLINHIKEGWI